MLLVKTRFLPFTRDQHLAQLLRRIPHILKTDVERCEAKAQDVGHGHYTVGLARWVARTEVAHHAAGDQDLHDGVSP